MKNLGDLHEHTDTQLTHISDLTEKLQEYKDDYIKKTGWM